MSSNPPPIRRIILQAFADQGGSYVSGGEIAKANGLSRGMVWKHISSLRQEGLPFEGSTRKGYRLPTHYDLSLLTLDRVPSKPRPWIIHSVIKTDSTQRLAREAAAFGVPEGHVWSAESQSAGRGRLGREWASNAGGLWMSAILRPSLAASQIPPLALIAGLALVQSIEEVTGIACRLKWPNDVVIKTQTGWRKVAGMLTEVSGELSRVEWVILGMGVNVTNVLPKLLAPTAITLGSIKSLPENFSRALLLQTFLRRFDARYRVYCKKGFEPARKDYWAWYSRPGEEALIKTADGNVRGRIIGIDSQGGLVLDLAGKQRIILEGDVVL